MQLSKEICLSQGRVLQLRRKYMYNMETIVFVSRRPKQRMDSHTLSINFSVWDYPATFEDDIDPVGLDDSSTLVQ